MTAGPARFKDKVVLITGAGRNIGRTAALAFAREGARVMVADHDAFTARDTVADLQDLTGACAWVRTDVLSEDDIARMCAVTVERFGRIDAFINNVGFAAEGGRLEEATAEVWDRAFALNVRQQTLCAKHVIPAMIRGGGGAIVNTGSVYSLTGGIESFTYCSAKAGIVSLTKHIAAYYAPHGIRANCVCPGHIVTPEAREKYERLGVVAQYPAGRLGACEDVAAAYLYLASDEASFVTGSVLLVDGGYTLF